MSIAVISDIHGNLPALDAVIAELRAEPPEAVVVGGGRRMINAGSPSSRSRRADRPGVDHRLECA